MIEKDELPIEAVTPTPVQRIFLKKLIQEISEYARSKNYTDICFQGHNDKYYFGAYSTEIIRRGAGIFIFGFDRRGGVLRFAFPIAVDEPRKLAKLWTGDSSRSRAVINIKDDPDEEMQLYIIELSKRSIDHHYNKNRINNR